MPFQPGCGIPAKGGDLQIPGSRRISHALHQSARRSHAAQCGRREDVVDDHAVVREAIVRVGGLVLFDQLEPAGGGIVDDVNMVAVVGMYS